MNHYKATVIFRNNIDAQAQLEERTIMIQALSERDAFQLALVNAAKCLADLHRNNDTWEYIGISSFEELDLVPTMIDCITILSEMDNSEAFIASVKYYGEALQQKISCIA